MKRLLVGSIVPTLLLASGVALAQPAAAPAQPPAWGPAMMGPGGPMMGGPGAGPRGGYGPWQGMGGGMMGGCGYGPGMGFGGMMGPGMMGGGMMGGGMMGVAGPALAALGLDEAQRNEVVKIGDELRKKRWAVAGQMQDEMAKIRDAAWSGKRDRASILAAHKRMSELGQQQLESSLDAADRIDKVLTPEQRQQLGRIGPWWMMGGVQ
ncbi:MAG: Spy/CpxP family protein refolding chaperone [Burkholderiaceae bacterium]|nr:Spy/CpxP family protein refolding chaperone [Burkholderiaceae bacterium]